MKYFTVHNKYSMSHHSNVSFRELVITFADGFSITEKELDQITELKRGETFSNNDLTITRVQ